MHAAMQRRLPGHRAIAIRGAWSDDRGSTLTVDLGEMDSLISARYSRHTSLLLLDIDSNTPSWKFWLLWVMSAMRMAAFRVVPDNYIVSFGNNPSPAFRRKVMKVIRLRFPQAEEH